MEPIILLHGNVSTETFRDFQIYYTQPFRPVKELPSGHSRKKSPLKMHYHFQVTTNDYRQIVVMENR